MCGWSVGCVWVECRVCVGGVLVICVESRGVFVVWVECRVCVDR